MVAADQDERGEHGCGGEDEQGWVAHGGDDQTGAERAPGHAQVVGGVPDGADRDGFVS